MAGMSVDGLISGMDTTTLITQLMQIEAQPQTQLKTRLADTQADAAAYRALNTRFAGLATAAAAVSNAATWDTFKATTSANSVTATAGTGATTGSLTFAVKAVAETHSLISAKTYGATSTTFATAGTTLQVKDSAGNATGASITFTTDTSLDDAVKAINAKTDLGFTAAPVQTAPNQFQLQLTATKSGKAGGFSLGGGGTFDVVTTGADAELSVGTATAAYKVTSATNDFAGLLPATTISVSQVTTSPVTVKVASDPDAIAAKVSALVTSANGLLDAISSYTDADSSTAVLKGDSTLRSLADRVLNTVATMLSGDGSASQAGLQLTKDGHLTFDSTTFVAKLRSDPAKVEHMFTAVTSKVGSDGKTVTTPTGIAGQLAKLAGDASDSTTGTLTLLAKSEDSTATDLKARISDWDTRLALRKQNLTAQFTAMETALGTLKNQGDWLTSQIAQLPTWSSSSKS